MYRNPSLPMFQHLRTNELVNKAVTGRNCDRSSNVPVAMVDDYIHLSSHRPSLASSPASSPPASVTITCCDESSPSFASLSLASVDDVAAELYPPSGGLRQAFTIASTVLYSLATHRTALTCNGSEESGSPFAPPLLASLLHILGRPRQCAEGHTAFIRGTNSLYHAAGRPAQHGHAECLAAMLWDAGRSDTCSRSMCDVRDTYTLRTPLHAAAAVGSTDCITVLLFWGVDVGARDKQSYTPLHSAAREGQLAATHALLQGGADPMARDSKGWTALHWAARLGHKEVVQALLTAPGLSSADVPCTPDSLSVNDPTRGWTPLHWAARRGLPDVVALLLKNGADPKATAHSAQHFNIMHKHHDDHSVAVVIGESMNDPEKWWSPLGWALYEWHLLLKTCFKQSVKWKEQQHQYRTTNPSTATSSTQCAMMKLKHEYMLEHVSSSSQQRKSAAVVELAYYMMYGEKRNKENVVQDPYRHSQSEVPLQSTGNIYTSVNTAGEPNRIYHPPDYPGASSCSRRTTRLPMAVTPLPTPVPLNVPFVIDFGQSYFSQQQQLQTFRPMLMPSSTPIRRTDQPLLPPHREPSPSALTTPFDWIIAAYQEATPDLLRALDGYARVCLTLLTTSAYKGDAAAVVLQALEGEYQHRRFSAPSDGSSKKEKKKKHGVPKKVCHALLSRHQYLNNSFTVTDILFLFLWFHFSHSATARTLNMGFSNVGFSQNPSQIKKTIEKSTVRQ